MRASEAAIVVADDDEEDYLLFQAALEEIGCDVPIRRVPDGQALLDLLRSSPLPRLVLVDVDMPGKNGLEALQEIKNDPILRKIPVIVLTGSRSRGTTDTAYLVGANACVNKSSDFDSILSLARAIQAFWLDLSIPPARSPSLTRTDP